MGWPERNAGAPVGTPAFMRSQRFHALRIPVPGRPPFTVGGAIYTATQVLLEHVNPSQHRMPPPQNPPAVRQQRWTPSVAAQAPKLPCWQHWERLAQAKLLVTQQTPGVVPVELHAAALPAVLAPLIPSSQHWLLVVALPLQGPPIGEQQTATLPELMFWTRAQLPEAHCSSSAKQIVPRGCGAPQVVEPAAPMQTSDSFGQQPLSHSANAHTQVLASQT